MIFLTHLVCLNHDKFDIVVILNNINPYIDGIFINILYKFIECHKKILTQQNIKIIVFKHNNMTTLTKKSYFNFIEYDWKRCKF